MTPNTGQVSRPLHGGHIASVHHLGGILQIAFFGKPEGQKVPDKAQIEAEEAQHQPAFLPELSSPQAQLTQNSSHQSRDGEHPGGGHQHQAGNQAGEQEGPFFRTLATISMNTGPIRMASIKWVANHT